MNNIYNMQTSTARRDHLWTQLCDLPYFRALLRAMEARFYEDLPVVAPVLDVGSGDGLFARQTFTTPLDLGIDPFAAPTHGSVFREGYKAISIAEGRALPVQDGSFQTVISNSVLEHIPDVNPVIAECFRVLKPGGYFLFCSPSDYFDRWLLGAKILGDTYRRFFQRIARHVTCDGADAWMKRLNGFGFTVEKSWYYFSPAAVRVFEAGHFLGLPNLITKKLFDRWVLWPRKNNPVLRLLHRWLEPIYNEPLPEKGACIFVVARKPER